MKKLKHFLESIPIILLYVPFRLMPLSLTRRICGVIARTLGPKLKVSRVGLENLAAAFPHEAPEKHHQTLRALWQNLGFVAGEFAHIKSLLSSPKRFTYENSHIVDTLVQEKRGAIFVGAHWGNWEVSHAYFIQNDIPIALIARHHKNPLIEWLLLKDRTGPTVSMLSRTAAGTKKLISLVQQGTFIGALVDQYARDGTFLPFFNRPASTTLALARLARKHNIPLVPSQVIRKGTSSTFTIRFHPPLEPSAFSTNAAMMTEVNATLESGIRENPAQWLWLHKRWKTKGRRP